MPLFGDAKREYDRLWIAERRDNFFSDKKCKWCESTENLELHHLDPTQKIANAIWSWSQERRDAEIVKCIILCKTCHRNYHDDLRRAKEHGSAMYQNGCRCRICKDAQAERLRNYRMKHGREAAIS